MFQLFAFWKRKTKLNKRRKSPRTAESRKRGATFQKLGNMTEREWKSSFVPTAILSNFARNGEDDWIERHWCNAMGKGDKQSTTRWLHYLLLSLLSLTGYGRWANGCQGTLQVPHATTRGVFQCRLRELLSLRGPRGKPQDVLSHTHQIHGLSTGWI